MPFCHEVRLFDENNQVMSKYLTYNFDHIQRWLSNSHADDSLYFKNDKKNATKEQIKFMFKELSKLYEANMIKDFAIYRSSLERVFVKLVQKQESLCDSILGTVKEQNIETETYNEDVMKIDD